MTRTHLFLSVDVDCWFNVAELTGQDLKLGQVIARRGDGTVEAMERHPDVEFLVPVTGPLIQVVAPGRDLKGAAVNLPNWVIESVERSTPKDRVAPTLEALGDPAAAVEKLRH